jgi:hypothetical protein
MILLFDMVLSLWRQVVVPISKQWIVDLIPAKGINGEKFQAIDGSRGMHTSRKV